jgi:hypothetical protein
MLKCLKIQGTWFPWHEMHSRMLGKIAGTNVRTRRVVLDTHVKLCGAVLFINDFPIVFKSRLVCKLP